ncbi:protein MpEXL4 [Marchantia polymorpha subsp. ruderalis]|uniref:Uncharacterized protein n=2 Tax=Marchantia polymorpha TaxID=3197 RepID=A0AAF6BWA3_MARPO|nr:hypothetical protein MARPO_0062s0021 [Marchantia polymorpha]BBN16287.1 hypothetical protein Mp_7g05050 [Marchantia polymorpha subsp. ruderalis]|eukprot:PTQ36595.1 hypothetical protein MARPO_0062s0021 [Marchantia polymorpha]
MDLTQVKCSALLMMFLLASVVDGARIGPVEKNTIYGGLLARRFLRLVESPETIIDYHNGPVMEGSNGTLPVYVIWYGEFNETDTAAVRDFFASFSPAADGSVTDVAKWWDVTTRFKDATGASVARYVTLVGERNDTYSLGKNLNNSNLEELVQSSLSAFPADPNAVYFVMTAADVQVEGFCMNSCASHFATVPSSTNELQLPYAWVGNAKDQCPGMCAWPFAQPPYMPAQADMPLPPNGNVGVDGMIVHIAYMLAGTATNPFNNAFYQGDAAAPLEAGTACVGSFGVGSYSGYPGELKKDVITGSKYNANGVNDRKFLLPALWDPDTRKCSPLAV